VVILSGFLSVIVDVGCVWEGSFMLWRKQMAIPKKWTQLKSSNSLTTICIDG
jgi:uncharacterized protein YbdZ (MbtH family)